MNRIIACESVAASLRRYLPADEKITVLEFGLHDSPEKLKSALQAEIDAAGEDVDTIILGYGLCSNALLGISGGRGTLVVPRVHDCISLFLGSREEYARQAAAQPGTYYLTRSWIEAKKDPYTEYLAFRERYGKEKADFIMDQYYSHYTRIAFIPEAEEHSEGDRAFSRHVADELGLAFEELPASDEVFRKLAGGRWDEDFIVLPPGKALEQQMFY